MKKLLLVDDERLLHKCVRRTLNYGNGAFPEMEIISAFDGQEGCNLFVADPGMYGLIITDTDMPPGMNGLEFLTKIKKYELPPRLLWSGRADSVLHQQAREAGALGCLEKPFSPQLLSQIVTELFQNRSHSPSLEEYFCKQYS